MNESRTDQFYDLKHFTIANVQAALRWAKERSIKTFIDYLDCSKSAARKPSDMAFDEVLELIHEAAARYFRIILRKNFNWFGILTNNKHLEDVIEMGIRGIMVGKKEIFVFCYLKKELFEEMTGKFALTQIT